MEVENTYDPVSPPEPTDQPTLTFAQLQNVIDWDKETVVGTCTKLEKPFLRLTSVRSTSLVRIARWLTSRSAGSRSFHHSTAASTEEDSRTAQD